jgi:hypothetical protein
MLRRAAAFLLLVSPAAGASQAQLPEPVPPDGGSGTTAPTPAPPIVVTGEKEAQPAKVVCESREETGSLFRKRICRTVTQNEEAADYARRAIAEISEERERRQQIQESICPTGPSPC